MAGREPFGHYSATGLSHRTRFFVAFGHILSMMGLENIFGLAENFVTNLTLKKINVGLLATFLTIFLVMVQGCKIVDRLGPNTMVKTYRLVTLDNSLTTKFYDANFQIRAREIGNKLGVDKYHIILELKSRRPVKPEEVGKNIPTARLKTLTIGEPGGNNSIVIGGDSIENPPAGAPPQIFREHLRYFFNARDILIMGEPDIIIVTAVLEFSDMNGEDVTTDEEFTAEFQFSKQLKWFELVN